MLIVGIACKKYFEQLIDKMKEEKGVQYDVDLTAADLKTLAEQFKAEYKNQLGKDFPSDPVASSSSSSMVGMTMP